MLKYAIYARKSHDDKKLTEKSTGEQVAECRAIAERDGLTVLRVFEESKSAKTPGVRPLYADLIKLVEKGKVDAVLCWHVNRLARNMEEGGKLVQLLIEGKIREIRTPHATYRSGDNILPVVVDAASATQYSLDLGNTVARSMEGNFRAGGCNHKAPPGYRNLREPLNLKRGNVEPDPTRFTLIERAWRLVLSGEHNFQEVHRQLHHWGFLMRPTLNMPARPMAYQTMLNMFKSPFYAGYVRKGSEVVKGRHKAMVSLDEFRKVQSILAARTFSIKRRHVHAFTGLMQCGYCGQQVTAEVKKLRTGLWETYHCSDSYNRCTKRGISRDRLEHLLLQAVRASQIDGESLQTAARIIKRRLRDTSESLRARREALEGKALQIEQRRKRLLDMWLSGLLHDEARYRAAEKELAREQEETVTLLDSSQLGEQLVLRNLSVSVKSLSEAAELFSSVGVEGKKRVSLAIGTIIFYGREKRVSVQLHPVLEQLARFARENSTPLEPLNESSHNQMRASFSKPLSFGGRMCSTLEPADSLIEALSVTDLPELPDRDIGETLARVVQAREY